MIFDGFISTTVDIGETTIFIRRKGHGRPLLLLHGFPQTHLMWHRVAPLLASQFTVICADLRGYGRSGKPESRPDHAPYSKRVMALDMVRMMETQGFTRFSVVGHDRGGRVAYRLALDHPERVEQVALFDVIPTSEAFERADAKFALGFWPWSLLAQPAPLPERLIGADPEAVVDNALSAWGSDRAAFPVDVRAAYIDALRDDTTVHAICEEYRAAATLDCDADNIDRQAGHRIAAPTLVLWSRDGALDRWYGDDGALTIWREWANDVRGRAIAGGHFFPEQNPVETTMELRAFLEPAEVAEGSEGTG